MKISTNIEWRNPEGAVQTNLLYYTVWKQNISVFILTCSN